MESKSKNELDEINKAKDKFYTEFWEDHEYTKEKLGALGYSEDFLETYKNFDYEEFVAFEDNLLKDNLVKTLALIDTDPFSFFYRFSKNQKREWFEKIRSVNPKDVITSDLPTEIKRKYISWLKKFHLFYQIEIKRSSELAHHSTIKVQAYILRLLESEGVINWNKLNTNVKDRSAVLGLLLNRGKQQAYTQLASMGHRNPSLTDSQMKKVRDAFEDTKNHKILARIKKAMDI